MSREIMQQALDALEMHVLGFDGVRKMELAIEAIEAELAKPEQEPVALESLRNVHKAQGLDGTWNVDQYMCGLYNGLELALAIFEKRDPVYKELAKPEQAKYSDIVSDGGLDPRNKFDAQPEQEPKLSDAGADTNISRGLEPKGSGMVTLNQVGMRVDLKDTPPRKEWVGLTDEELNLIYAEPQTHVGQYARAIEAKLREKNGAT
jgi:hypothetical protein